MVCSYVMILHQSCVCVRNCNALTVATQYSVLVLPIQVKQDNVAS